MKKVIVLLALMLLVACGAAEPRPMPTLPDIDIRIPRALPRQPAYEPPPTAPTYEGEHIVEITIDAQTFAFLPSEIRVKKGDRVKLIITAVDVPHTFTMPAFEIDQILNVGADTTIEFIADREGTFGFFCDVPGHMQQGMKGTFTVK